MIYTRTEPCTRCGAVWNYDFEISWDYYTLEHFCLSCLINQANVYYDFNVKIIPRKVDTIVTLEDKENNIIKE